jgi:alkanesulfonate monooxygenase SsuD/methylene tetrahydromethanopterin reductase-like flavin-dependent oxidoreductase (luciferase family)
MVGLPVIAAEDDERAEYLASSLYQRFLGMVRNDRKQTQPPVKAMGSVWSASEEAAVRSMLQFLVVGGPQKVRRELEALLTETQADELILFSEFFDPADRIRSYEIVATAKGMV